MLLAEDASVRTDTTTGSRRGWQYGVVAGVWLLTRIVAVATVSLTPQILADLTIYQRWLPYFHAGAFPGDDPTWQYPPGVSLLIEAAAALPTSFRWSFAALMMAFDAAIMAALLVARARRPAASWRGPWAWAVAGLLLGSILYVRFDLAPTLLAVLAVLFATSRPVRPVLAGAAAGVGALLKVWPVLMVVALPRRRLSRGAAAAAATVIGLMTVWAMATQGSRTFLANQGARGLQLESVGALPYLVVARLGGRAAPTGYEYGSIQVLADGTALVGLGLSALGVVVMAAIAWRRWRGRLDHAQPGDVALALVLVSVATSRVYSPQFTIWLVGIAAVALLDRASRATVPAALVLVTAGVTQVVYPWRMDDLIAGDPATIVVQAVRIAALVVAACWSLLALRQPRSGRRHVGRKPPPATSPSASSTA